MYTYNKIQNNKIQSMSTLAYASSHFLQSEGPSVLRSLIQWRFYRGEIGWLVAVKQRCAITIRLASPPSFIQAWELGLALLENEPWRDL